MYIYVRKTMGSWFFATTTTALPTCKNFPYWPGKGSFKNCNIITLSHKSTISEDFEETNQVFLGGISNNMASLVQYGRYGAINTTYTTTIGYYVIKLVLEDYTLQEDTTPDE